jgi:diguanylate cyclase (GGDEF)-like protein
MNSRHLLWGRSSLISLLASWWRQPDQFDWVTNYLIERGVFRSAQLTMALVASSAALIPVTLLVDRHNVDKSMLAVAIGDTVFTVAMTAFWLRRWPTRLQSETAALAGLLGITGWSLAQSNPAAALLACGAGAISGGYLAFFHSVKSMALNFSVVIVVAVIAAVRMADDMNPVDVISGFWVVWFLNLAVPVAIRGMSRAMQRYSVSSDEDPLTGLLNRRGFIKMITRRVSSAPMTDTHLIVVMVDLDDFKCVNDTHGHPTGDRLLVSVAELMRIHSSPDAAICRAGGEEFLIALTSAAADAFAIANTLCTAIAELSPPVTASIGTTCAELETPRQPEPEYLIECAIAAADKAMYSAKRKGGNQARHICLGS